ncbi:hypothetical protein GCM10025868_10290 [Angustibacter aerolatus]|uniref:Ribose-5-phosphate isomerase n=1 Tax=Angustibacter aerolatus TaxID=1162965 RepID=A0ABQ6JED0_9ACTN|nr:hypothetical protein GCM10025868_10290 [Angustibacter aerolatus]
MKRSRDQGPDFGEPRTPFPRVSPVCARQPAREPLPGGLSRADRAEVRKGVGGQTTMRAGTVRRTSVAQPRAPAQHPGRPRGEPAGRPGGGQRVEGVVDRDAEQRVVRQRGQDVEVQRRGEPLHALCDAHRGPLAAQRSWAAHGRERALGVHLGDPLGGVRRPDEQGPLDRHHLVGQAPGLRRDPRAPARARRLLGDHPVRVQRAAAGSSRCGDGGPVGSQRRRGEHRRAAGAGRGEQRLRLDVRRSRVAVDQPDRAVETHDGDLREQRHDVVGVQPGAPAHRAVVRDEGGDPPLAHPVDTGHRAHDRDPARLCGMRVHIGGDHAAFDLKQHLVQHLEAQGFDVVDHGPDHYDADDDYPVSVLRAAMGVRSDEGSLGVVLGGSGNGEQIAANKVEGIRCALAWSVETAQARPGAQRRPGGVGRRAHARARGGHAHRRGLPRHLVQPRRAAPAPAAPGRRLRGHRRAPPVVGTEG